MIQLQKIKTQLNVAFTVKGINLWVNLEEGLEVDHFQQWLGPRA